MRKRHSEWRRFVTHRIALVIRTGLGPPSSTLSDFLVQLTSYTDAVGSRYDGRSVSKVVCHLSARQTDTCRLKLLLVLVPDGECDHGWGGLAPFTDVRSVGLPSALSHVFFRWFFVALGNRIYTLRPAWSVSVSVFQNIWPSSGLFTTLRFEVICIINTLILNIFCTVELIINATTSKCHIRMKHHKKITFFIKNLAFGDLSNILSWRISDF